MKANYEKRWVSITVGRTVTEVEVGPGQFVFGRHSAAKELKMNPATVYKRIVKLKNMQNLIIDSSSHYSIISIVNWEHYQGCEEKSSSESSSRVAAGEQPGSSRGTQYKKDNNNKKYKNTPPTPPKGDAVSLYEFYRKTINPEKKSRQRAIMNITYYLKNHPIDDLRSAIENYASEITSKGTGPKYRKDPANFFGKIDPTFVDYVPGVFANDDLPTETTYSELQEGFNDDI